MMGIGGLRVEGFEGFIAVLYLYTGLYGAKIVLLALLSAITIYRREMSCNHVYNSISKRNTSSNSLIHMAEQESKEEPAQDDAHSHTDYFAILSEWDDLLEGATQWGSGGLLLETLYFIWCNVKLDSITKLLQSQAVTLENQASEEELERLVSEKWDGLLEGVGEWGSGEPLVAVLLSALGSKNQQESPNSRKKRFSRSSFSIMSSLSCTFDDDAYTKDDYVVDDDHDATHPSCHHPLTDDLAGDVQVQMLSYLHPRDVVSFACVNRASHRLVDRCEMTSKILWKMLWERDYAWVVREWPIGKEAWQRRCQSRSPQVPHSKSFYFEFGQSYLNFCLAGQNTPDRCLVGLRGNVYDVTDFLDEHPGSPDTVLVEAGKDATDYFEDIGHSRIAMGLSRSLCVLVDPLGVPNSRGVGLRPPTHKDESLLSLHRRLRRPASLLPTLTKLDRQQEHYRRLITRKLSRRSSILGPVNVYYDPFDRSWKAWYTDTNTFQPVFHP